MDELEKKLLYLQAQLRYLEVEGAEDIRVKRIEADMGDDYRENEGAKLVMEQHDILFIRRIGLMREILTIKKELIALKLKKSS